MPTTLLSANIKGIRSYSPDQTQTIDFMPLTLIVGKNGTGKTSIIECLKFIIAGEEPPFSDSRRNFIHTPKQSVPKPQQRSGYASIQLNFLNSQNEHCMAKREISLANLSKGPPQISSSYRMGQRAWQNVNKLEDWSKTLPKIFDLQNQAILNNVILCHQENNLWCLDDSSTVKQIFDKIFGCEQYKREILYIDMELKKLRPEVQMFERDLLHLKDKVARKHHVESHIEMVEKQIKSSSETIKAFMTKIETAKLAKRKITDNIAEIESRSRQVNNLLIKIESLRTQEKDYLSTQKFPDELKSSSLEDLKTKSSEVGTSLSKNQDQLNKCRKEEEDLRREIKDSEAQRLELQQKADDARVKRIHTANQKERLKISLNKLTNEYAIDLGGEETSNEKSLELLEDFVKQLAEQKSDLVQREDTLSNELRTARQKSSCLEGDSIGLQQRIKSKEIMINRLERQLCDADPVARDLNTVMDNIQSMHQCVDQLEDSDPVKNLRALLSDTQSRLTAIGKKIGQENVSSIRDELTKEKNDIDEYRVKLHLNDKEKIELKSQLTNLEAEQNQVASSLKNIQNKLMNFRSSKSDLEHLYNLVESAKSTEGPEVESAMKKLEEFTNKMEQKRGELDSISMQRDSLNGQAIQLHKLQEDYKKASTARLISQQIIDAESELSFMEDDVEDVKNLDQLKVEELEIDRRIREISERKSVLVGAIEQLEVDLKRFRVEGQSLAEVYQTYSKYLGKLVLWRIIEKDLMKLKECFNASIIAFHDRMILKVNQVLKMRWRQIYKGTDIDSIELVDEEIARGRDKRYNYYIAMRKGNVRMKMREQASAGQKALACIIVRMTLAELFVRDFAFMALDEPTANLDKQNVESLAKTVGQHVRRRAKNGVNIQWIIITHDEHFIKALDKECSPFYYRIHMDSNGHSKISKVAVSAVDEKEAA